MSENSIALRAQGLRRVARGDVRPTLRGDSGRCNLVLRLVQHDFPEQSDDFASITEFKQIEFLDITRSSLDQSRPDWCIL